MVRRMACTRTNGAVGKKGCSLMIARLAGGSSTISARAGRVQPAQVTEARGSLRRLRIQSERQ